MRLAVVACLILTGCEKLLGLDDIKPQPDAAPDAPSPNMVVGVVTGGITSCARLLSGEVWCWGYGGTGELGNGLFLDSAVPVVVETPAMFVRVDAGDAGECGVTADGPALCWGNNLNGALGIGSTSATSLPIGVTGVTGVDEIAIGYDISCARHGGAVACAGTAGFLGDGSMTNRATFGDVTGITDAIHLTTGDDFSCALRAGGATACWGDNSSGQLGQPAGASQPSPVAGPVGPYVALAAGDRFACGLKASGAIECWGDNSAGQLGDGTMTSHPDAQAVAGIGDATAIAAISYTTCALRRNGTVWCWGAGDTGQLGDGQLGAHNSLAPVEVSGLTNVVQVSARHGASACARRDDATIWCWGSNFKGQLGDGTTTDRAAPVQVRGLPP